MLLVALVPVGVVVVRAPALDALVALEAAGTVATLVLLALAEGFARPSYFVLPLVAPPVSVAGALVFLRWFERE